jgi:type I restriction enzyme, S subunit
MIECPYLRVANVQRGWLDLKEVKNIEVTEQEASRLYLRYGDILMNEGGDRDKLGRGWFWEGQIENCIHQNHVFRVRLYDPKFPPKLISLYANEIGQSHFFDEGTQTTNLASISKTRLSSLPLRLPPVREALEILARIETAFAWIDRLASETTNARRLIDHLDRAILAKAFRGDLVPQDPNDEPASVLLERIRAERQATPAPRSRSEVERAYGKTIKLKPIGEDGAHSN